VRCFRLSRPPFLAQLQVLTIEDGVGNAFAASPAPVRRSCHPPPLRHTGTHCTPLGPRPSDFAASGFAAFQCPARFSGPMPSAHPRPPFRFCSLAESLLQRVRSIACLPIRLARYCLESARAVTAGPGVAKPGRYVAAGSSILLRRSVPAQRARPTRRPPARSHPAMRAAGPPPVGQVRSTPGPEMISSGLRL
jgi:hypothetical protein